jgi:hypothetical protein
MALQGIFWVGQQGCVLDLCLDVVTLHRSEFSSQESVMG